MLALMGVVTLLGLFIALQDHPTPKYEPVIRAKNEAVPAKHPDVVGGIHQPTGLVAEQNYELVLANCISCHSASLITQNRMDAKGWRKTIRWMQETQKLWDLGDNTDKIIAYLADNYAPKETGRRKNLKLEKDDWYRLE